MRVTGYDKRHALFVFIADPNPRVIRCFHLILDGIPCLFTCNQFYEEFKVALWKHTKVILNHCHRSPASLILLRHSKNFREFKGVSDIEVSDGNEQHL